MLEHCECFASVEYLWNAVDVHDGEVPGRKRDGLVVPERRDVAVRALENQQGFCATLELD
jgi:hypothetical protein